jgi:hypothetical protein
LSRTHPSLATAKIMAMYWPDKPTSTRQPAWTWSALTDTDRSALDVMVTDWAAHYNQVYAVREQDAIPPCWRQHPWLAQELAVMVFLWWSAHRDPTATPERAAEFYLRHLPGFRARLAGMLGRSPTECQQGLHPETWRRDLDTTITDWPPQHCTDPDAVEVLGAADFGFPRLTP